MKKLRKERIVERTARSMSQGDYSVVVDADGRFAVVTFRSRHPGDREVRTIVPVASLDLPPEPEKDPVAPTPVRFVPAAS